MFYVPIHHGLPQTLSRKCRHTRPDSLGVTYLSESPVVEPSSKIGRNTGVNTRVPEVYTVPLPCLRILYLKVLPRRVSSLHHRSPRVCKGMVPDDPQSTPWGVRERRPGGRRTTMEGNDVTRSTSTDSCFLKPQPQTSVGSPSRRAPGRTPCPPPFHLVLHAPS